MPYFIAFTNGEDRELIVEADAVTHESDPDMMIFRDREGKKIAYIPIERILYVKRTEE